MAMDKEIMRQRSSPGSMPAIKVAGKQESKIKDRKSVLLCCAPTKQQVETQTNKTTAPKSVYKTPIAMS